ncbi:MAG: cation diffusion facilitator family transporter [Chitinophagales bacterium]|nr:cation diffusion facilitator family transporter [Chitinophagales bacterium]MDW8418160.1 cation diffusion facilitator family transporter [Chitinophagales bacterium]
MQQNLITNSLNFKLLIRLQLLALIGGCIILSLKFVAYFITHSNAIFTDALESIINVAAGAFALYSIYISSKPTDADHPYGHGKIEFLSAGFEGILIVIAGFGIIIKSVIAFIRPAVLEHLDAGLIITVTTGLANYIIGWWLQHYGKKHQSLVLIADGEHLKSDAYSSLAIIAGIIVVMVTGWQWLDNILAIVIGFYILYTGTRLVRKSVAGIMDEADETVVSSVINSINAHRKPQWVDVHNLRVIQYGSMWHVDCHVTLPWYYTLQQAHDEIDEISRLVNAQNDGRIEFFIHADACVENSCRICSLRDCPHRIHPQERTLHWDVSLVRQNQKHGI